MKRKILIIMISILLVLITVNVHIVEAQAGCVRKKLGDCDCPRYRGRCPTGQYCSIGEKCNPKPDPTKPGGIMKRKCIDCDKYEKDPTGRELHYDKNCRRCEATGFWVAAREGQPCSPPKGGKCKEGFCVKNCENPDGKPGDIKCIPKDDYKNNVGKCGIDGKWIESSCLKIAKKNPEVQNRLATGHKITNWGCFSKRNKAYCWVKVGGLRGIRIYVTDSNIGNGYRAGSRDSRLSIYLLRQKDCYTPDGYAYQLISDIKEFNLPILKIFYTDRNCEGEITGDSLILQRFEDYELETNEVLRSCNIEYGPEETVTISSNGGEYNVLCDSGICHTILEVPRGAVNEDTIMTIRELILSNCTCGDGTCGIGESAETCSTDCPSCTTNDDCNIYCDDWINFYQTGSCIAGTCRNLQYNENCSPISFEIIEEIEITTQDLFKTLNYYSQDWISLQEMLETVELWVKGYRIID